MHDLLTTYVMDSEHPVSSLELTKNVLKLELTDQALADRLVAPVLSESGQIHRTEDGYWVSESQAESETESGYTLCMLFPNPVEHWGKIREIHCAGLDSEPELFEIDPDTVSPQLEYIFKHMSGTLVMDGF